MDIYCTILILFLLALHECIGNETATTTVLSTPEFDNINTTALNNTFSGNGTIFLHSRIIVYMPEIPVKTESNELAKFGNFLQAFFGQLSHISNITPIQDDTFLENGLVKNRRDLSDIWNSAKDISQQAHNTTKDTYQKVADSTKNVYEKVTTNLANIPKLIPRSVPVHHDECTDLMCKAHVHMPGNITEDTENIRNFKAVRSLGENLTELATGNETELQPFKDDLFELTTNDDELNTTAKINEKRNVNLNVSDVLGVNETLNSDNSSTMLPHEHDKRAIGCDEKSGGCVSKTSAPEALETTKYVTTTDGDFFKYRDWLWQHIESARNGSLNSNSSDHFLKRHYFLSKSGGTEKSTTAKNSGLLIADEFTNGKKMRHRRAKQLPLDLDDDPETFFAQQFRYKKSENIKFLVDDDDKIRYKVDKHGSFNIEKEYNDGGNQPTKPLLLFVTIPSFIGIAVFVLALCFLTRSGAWCCRLFDPPQRNTSRTQLSKANAELSQPTSA